jgi:hypothetical protein
MPTKKVLGIIASAVGSLFLSAGMFWFTFSTWSRAYDGYCIERDWRPPPQPYTARVVGFPIWGVGRRERIPTVRITFAGGKVAEFNSSRRGNYSEGDEVAVLTTPMESVLKVGGDVLVRRPYNAYEIDSAFHLWIRDALYGLFFLGIAVGSPIVGFMPFLSLAKPRGGTPEDA